MIGDYTINPYTVMIKPIKSNSQYIFTRFMSWRIDIWIPRNRLTLSREAVNIMAHPIEAEETEPGIDQGHP